MKKQLIVLALLLFVVACVPSQKEVPSEPVEPTPEVAPASEVTEPETEVPEPKIVEVAPEPEVQEPQVTEITIEAKRWEFIPSTITVNKGDTVKLTIKSIDVSHGFNLATFGVNKRLEPGRETTVEFVADKTGEFSFFCNVSCGRGHSGMKGTLVVR